MLKLYIPVQLPNVSLNMYPSQHCPDPLKMKQNTFLYIRDNSVLESTFPDMNVWIPFAFLMSRRLRVIALI